MHIAEKSATPAPGGGAADGGKGKGAWKGGKGKGFGKGSWGKGKGKGKGGVNNMQDPNGWYGNQSWWQQQGQTLAYAGQDEYDWYGYYQDYPGASQNSPEPMLLLDDPQESPPARTAAGTSRISTKKTDENDGWMVPVKFVSSKGAQLKTSRNDDVLNSIFPTNIAGDVW